MTTAIRHLCTLLTLTLATACVDTSVTHPVLVDSRDEAAAVLVSVTSVAPWDQVADAMQPNFALTGDQALQQVLPTTERIQEQVLSAFGLSLGLGLPQSFSQSSATKTGSSSETTTTTTAGTTASGTTTAGNTNSATSTTQPGTVPWTPTGIPGGAPALTAPSASGDIGLDPILRYQAALALYQAVQLMNREVQYAALRDHYVAYLVRVKFAVMPYRRNIPYDLHARMSFFPGLAPRVKGGPCAAVTTLPQIVPLLVTDDIERALKSRAVETARQIGLALSFMIHGVGGNLGANNLNQSLAAISGQDINSRLTVARLSDNTLYARVGAAYQSTAGVGLVGQTYDVSLLLLVPPEYFAVHDCIPQVDVLTHNDLRDALGGGVLADRPPATLASQASAAMHSSLGLVAQCRRFLKAWDHSDTKTKTSLVRLLAGPIQQSKDFADFESAVEEVHRRLMKNEPDECLSVYAKALWTRVSAVLADSAFKSAFFELRKPEPIIVSSQPALLLDDSKDKAQISLQVSSGQPSQMIRASLKLAPKAQGAQSSELVAQTIVFDPSARLLTLTFPSPTKWGLDEFDPKESQLEITRVCRPGLPAYLCPDLQVPSSFALRYAVAKASDGEPNLSFTQNLTQVVATKTGDGAVTVIIDKVKDDYAVITVTGVDVKSAVDDSGTPLKISNGKIQVSRPGTITFQLRNLHTGMTFTIQAEGHKGATTTGKKQLQFTVLGG